MKKRFLTIVLALVLMLTFAVFALAACDDKTPNTKNELGAYVLSDKGTYLSYKKNAEGDQIPKLELLLESDNDMLNTYSMIAVDEKGEGFNGANVDLNEIGADCFIKWMSLATTRAKIADYGKDKYNEALFYLLDTAEVYTLKAAESLSFASSGESDNKISISTTTSVNDTGLLGAMETIFEAETGWDIEVASAGTGAAIQAAKDGLADLLLVHSKSQEDAFVTAKYARKVDGFTAERIPFMYNYFVLVGPSNDPAGVKTAGSVVKAFEAIASGKYNFISRGDTSGTHTKELNLWAKSTSVKLIDMQLTYQSKGVDKTADSKVVADGMVQASWYISAGRGMGACLTMANEYKTK